MQSFSLTPSSYGIELLSEVEELQNKLKAIEQEKAKLIKYIQALEEQCDSKQLEAARIILNKKDQ